MSQLFDPLRKIWVAKTPEEIVRRRLLQKMVGELGYPKELIAVEKEIAQLPHLAHTPIPFPDRRIDILCFAKNIHPHHPLYPLLMIECKKDKIDARAQEQLLGYNHYVQSFFIALAGDNEILFGYRERPSSPYRFHPFLPPYQQLLAAIKEV